MQICDLSGGHGLVGPVDLGDGDTDAGLEGGGDEGIEGELGGEAGVGEDGRGRGDQGVIEKVGGDGISCRGGLLRVHTLEDGFERDSRGGFVGSRHHCLSVVHFHRSHFCRVT